MWIVYAAGSAFFAGLTSILAKCGIKRTDSDVATAIRTIVVLIFSWIMVFVAGSQKGIGEISTKSLLFLILSGLATGASWLCYFKALQLGDINKVVPIDKSSTVLTIILAFILFKEPIGIMKAVGIAGIAAGTYLMIERKENKTAQATRLSENETGDTAYGKKNLWIVYAVLSAVFASLTSILGKFGIEGVESNLGTAIRTIVVLVMSWVVVFAKGKKAELANVRKNELGFIVLSGFATGASWLCYYRALQDGPASIVVPIDKLSILITIAFSYFVFKEKLSKKAMVGLVLIVAGTLVMLIK
ncbi:MAG: EamA family transporter [Lachnospiraceae bacterium]